MICLTGDIHQASLRTGNQAHAPISEIQIALRYLRWLEQANVKVTFLISGKCFVEEWEDLRAITTHPLVEVGGHNWSCFSPTLLHRVSNKLLGSYNGPAWYQRWDAARTLAVVRERTGKRIRCWRNHMYMHGPHTERVLASLGIVICSDGVSKDVRGPVWHRAGVYNFPINVIPDHEHIYHAERTPEWVAAWRTRYAWRDDFGPDSYEIDEWAELVLAQLQDHEERGIVSNLIIHPITMYLADRFAAFRRILEFIQRCESVHMSEVVAFARTRRS